MARLLKKLDGITVWVLKCADPSAPMFFFRVPKKLYTVIFETIGEVFNIFDIKIQHYS